jgi:4-methyl-5(b-hydroxyethyl)-thiazole monophosphate biosynthesis
MIYVHLAQGFEEIEAVTVVDILRRGGLDAKTVSVTGQREVTGSHGITLTADLLFEDADYGACEMMVLPGGLPGTTNLQKHKALMETLVGFSESGRPVAAICAAPMIFGAMGLVRGKRATIYPGMEDELKGALVQHDLVVEDDGVVTSQGPATAMEFALALLARMAGQKTADRVKGGLLL